MVVAAVMGASTVLPPGFRIATPASAASVCGVATSPRVACRSAQRVAAVTSPMIQTVGRYLRRRARPRTLDFTPGVWKIRFEDGADEQAHAVLRGDDQSRRRVPRAGRRDRDS